MATKAEIRDRAANKMGILPRNQQLKSEDDVRMSAAVDEVYAQLKKDGKATWASTGTTPDELTPHVIALVAENAMGDFSIPSERYARIKQDAAIARRDIAKFTVSDYSPPNDVEDF